jgi:hypothetical protein
MSQEYPLDRPWNPSGRHSMVRCPIVNTASQEFLEKLGRIEPGVWGWPCEVSLKDGSFHGICLAWENKRYSDLGNWINPNQVDDIRELNSRMPGIFSREIHDAGESGMGYHIYVVELADGNSFVHVAGNLTIDLLNLPTGYTSSDVTNVRPHAGRERSRTEGYRQVDDYTSLEFSRMLDV